MWSPGIQLLALYAEWTTTLGARAILGCIDVSPILTGTPNNAKQRT